MRRRWWAVVVPQAITLLVYLLMPEPFAPSASAAALPVIGVHAGQTPASDTAHDDSGKVMTASDEVAMAPREWAETQAPAGRDALCLTSATPPDPVGAGPGQAPGVSGSALARLRPSLAALQVLRC